MSMNPTTLKSSEERFLAAIDIITADIIMASLRLVTKPSGWTAPLN